MRNIFMKDSDLYWTELGEGVRRKILAHNDDLMLVKVAFEKGAVGTLHQHVHVQTSYVSTGKFSYRIGEEERILDVGDSCVIPSMTLHGCTCLEAGELIDCFTPLREDFM
ncbi:cupin domain-containing protein [Sphingobacterium oryzagri]|uniref:Cupin domain-containing protein n=1 Tax=Sphingobacterium oryzagri TaxID=3025669 RepID=A0ABY7WH56_9SPHI|nr:cupin domain-containing protein [Sphingobacterium sp. KACC 22765]WDF67944.1 cupin domain-containing protein [Sphingobacterium sp. KACC 22765]